MTQSSKDPTKEQFQDSKVSGREQTIPCPAWTAGVERERCCAVLTGAEAVMDERGATVLQIFQQSTRFTTCADVCPHTGLVEKSSFLLRKANSQTEQAGRQAGRLLSRLSTRRVQRRKLRNSARRGQSLSSSRQRFICTWIRPQCLLQVFSLKT